MSAKQRTAALDINPDVDNPPASSLQPPADLPRGRQTEEVLCPYCGKRCVAKSSPPFFTYYYCENEDCPVDLRTHRLKKARPHIRREIAAAAEEDFSAR